MVQIRLARADDDFAAVARLYLTAWQHTYANDLPADFLAQLTPANWQPQYHWQHRLLIFDDQQLLVGTAAFGPARTAQFSGWGELNAIYLLPTAQHRGVGQQVMQRALRELQQLGFTRVMLWVLVTNHAARQFYQHCGFVPTTYTQIQGPIHEMAYVWPAAAQDAGSEE